CGPLRTQGNFQILNPYQSNSWYEYWMPVAGTKGFVKANKEIILNLEYREGRVKVLLNVTRKIKNPEIRVYLKEKLLVSKKITLLPEKTENFEVKLKNEAKKDKVRVEIREAGKELLSYEREVSKIGLYESEEPVKKEYEDIHQKMYLSGLELEKQRQFLEAEKKYGEILEKNKKYIPALLRLGVLALSRGLIETAEKLLKEVRERDPNNMDACYYLGLAYRFLGDNKKALENFWQLNLNDSIYSVGAFVEIGKIELLEGNYPGAAIVLKKAYVKCAHSPKLTGLYSAALRKAGRINGAKQIARDFGSWEPVDPLTINEDRLLNKNIKSAETLARILKRDKENALELSTDYISAGLYEEALEILRLGAKNFPNYPLYYYHMAYCLEKLDKLSAAKKLYIKAARLKGLRVFPWQIESYLILKQAAEKWVPKHPNTHEYLGNFLFYKMRYKEGLESFHLAKKLGSKSPIVFRNIALGYLKDNQDKAKTAKAYVAAVKKAPFDWEIYVEADICLTGFGRLKERREIYSAVSKDIFVHPKAQERRAKVLLDLGKFEEGINVMLQSKFYPWEGGEVSIRNIYETLYNSRAEQLIRGKKYEEAEKNLELAVSYPENLHTGKHFGRIHSRNLFLRGLLHQRLKEENEADKYWNELINEGVDLKHIAIHQL
ncbi:MAG: tetratricopeptide repeat protein, partial [Candidatus Firestonebacteria bacterium]